IVERRGAAERALSERSERHEAHARRAFATRSAHERLELRREQASATASALSERIATTQRELELLGEALAGTRPDTEQVELVDGPSQVKAEGPRAGALQRVAALEEQLAELERERELELERGLADLAVAREQAGAAVADLEREQADAKRKREQADAD